MAKLLADRRVVGGLAALACLVVYQRIVVPLLPDPAMSAQWDGTLDDELGDDAGDEGMAQPQLQLATAQYDLRNLDIGALTFNESPARDPFIDRPVVVAPLAEVDLSATRVKPAATRTVPAQPRLPRLTAIAFADDDRAAVLDNRIVRAGDAIDAFEVTAIARRQVTLRAANAKTFTLSLKP